VFDRSGRRTRTRAQANGGNHGCGGGGGGSGARGNGKANAVGLNKAAATEEETAPGKAPATNTLGALNAAHASPKARGHAALNSRLGKIAPYLDAGRGHCLSRGRSRRCARCGRGGASRGGGSEKPRSTAPRAMRNVLPCRRSSMRQEQP
jgi:hypothetical protein